MGDKGKVKKYELLEREKNGLCRIRALIEIPRYHVKIGEIGGYVESELNLEHDGDCWIFDDACAIEKANVHGNAGLFNHSVAKGSSGVGGNVRLFHWAEIRDYARASMNATLSDYACVSDSARIYGDAEIEKQAHLTGCASMSGHSVLSGSATLRGNISLCEWEHIADRAIVEKDSDYCLIRLERHYDTITLYASRNTDNTRICRVGWRRYDASFEEFWLRLRENPKISEDVKTSYDIILRAGAEYILNGGR